MGPTSKVGQGRRREWRGGGRGKWRRKGGERKGKGGVGEGQGRESDPLVLLC